MPKNLEKPKIFIRYLAGSSGTFLHTLLRSIYSHIHPYNSGSGHRIFNLHGVPNSYRWGSKNNHTYDKEFFSLTDFNNGFSDADAGKIIKEKLVFLPADEPVYFIPAHMRNHIPVQLAFPDAKMVNILVDSDDQYQLTHNFVSKNVLVMPNKEETIRVGLEYVQKRYKKLLNFTYEDLDFKRDLHLISYIVHYASTDQDLPFYSKEYASEHFVNDELFFNMTFKELTSMSIVDRYYELVDFLGLEKSQARKENFFNILKNYNASQEKATLTFSLDDYE